MSKVPSTMPLSEALKEAEALGIVVEKVRRTGEVAVYVPGQPRLAINNRRKDAPRTLMMLIRRRRQVTQ